MESIILPIYKKGDKTVLIIEEYYCYQVHTKFYTVLLSQG